MKRIVIAALSVCWFASLALAGDARTTLRQAKVRSGPGVFHPILERLDKGVALGVIGEQSGWMQVQSPSGQKGWVSQRAFMERPAPKGYQKVLEQRALKGVSTTVATASTRGLSGARPLGKGRVSEATLDFLERAAFAPDAFTRHMALLVPRPSCVGMAGRVDLFGQQVAGDDQFDELERGLGLSLAARALADVKLVTDAELDAYVNMVGMAVVLVSSRYDLFWRFVVFEQAEPEAFSLPGGFVFLSTGLLDKLSDEAQLAGVLAHEIAHVALAHGADQLQQKETKVHVAADDAFGELDDMGRGMEGFRDFSDVEADLDEFVQEAYRHVRADHGRAREIEADQLGAVLAGCAGYDPSGLARALSDLSSFERHGGDYPAAGDRIAKIKSAIADSDLSAGQQATGRWHQNCGSR